MIEPLEEFEKIKQMNKNDLIKKIKDGYQDYSNGYMNSEEIDVHAYCMSKLKNKMTINEFYKFYESL